MRQSLLFLPLRQRHLGGDSCLAVGEGDGVAGVDVGARKLPGADLGLQGGDGHHLEMVCFRIQISHTYRTKLQVVK